MTKNSGHIVRTKNGKIGRTYHNKPYINGKAPVYLEKTEGKKDFSDTAILCDPETCTIIGFID